MLGALSFAAVGLFGYALVVDDCSVADDVCRDRTQDYMLGCLLAFGAGVFFLLMGWVFGQVGARQERPRPVAVGAVAPAIAGGVPLVCVENISYVK